MGSHKFKIAGIFVLIIVVNLTAASCDLFQDEGLDPEDYSSYKVIVEVVDEVTGSNIQEVTLSIEDVRGEYIHAEETDETGLYVFENVNLEDNEEFRIIANKEGYASKEITAVADQDPVKLTGIDAVKMVKGEIEHPIEITGPDYVTKRERATFKVRSNNEAVSNFPIVVAEEIKYTDESGQVSFQLDEIGCFKAKSYLENISEDKLFWVFPETSRDLEINSLRYHGDHPRHSFFYKRMTGANSISIKAYYVFDDKGNISPIILAPFDWQEVSHKTKQEFLKYQIDKVRDWGFDKIYLHIEVLSPAYLGWEETEIEDLDEPARQNYLNNIEKEAMILAEFSQNKSVDILTPFENELGWDEIERYKDNLKELRDIYGGKLGVKLTGDVNVIGDSFYKQVKPEIKVDLSEFDVIFPIAKLDIPDMSLIDDSIHQSQPPSLYQTEQAVEEFLDFYQKIGDKYQARIMPQWIAQYGFKPGVSDQFLSYFSNKKEAFAWLYETILAGITERNMYGGSAYKTQYTRPRHEVDYTTDTQLYHSVASYFSQEGEIDFLSREHHKSQHEIKISENPSDEDENPLGIEIDGSPKDWEAVDPVYFNPSQTFPAFEWLKEGGRESFKSERLNLKAIYVMNDNENLYIMIEFYGEAISVEELRNSGYNLEIKFDIEGDAEWNYEAELLPSKGKIDSKNGERVTEFPYGDKEVYELKIPLEALDHPKEITLFMTDMSHYQGMLDIWARGMEIPIIDIEDIVDDN